MSQKQKVLGGVAAIIVLLLSGGLYVKLSAPRVPLNKNISSATNLRVNQQKAQQLSDAALIPATPDAAVDAIIDEAALDDQTLQTDVNDEQQAITTSGENINNLTQTYDENKL